MGETKFLEQINAIVSHEMRNPLNAMLSMVSKISKLTQSMRKNLDQGPEKINLSKLDKDLHDIEGSLPVLECSTKQLNLTVNDMLALAQINKDKFRVNLATFDL